MRNIIKNDVTFWRDYDPTLPDEIPRPNYLKLFLTGQLPLRVYSVVATVFSFLVALSSLILALIWRYSAL